MPLAPVIRPPPLPAADLIAVLAAAHFRADLDDPANPGNDRFVLSKGHASVLLYSWLKTMGAINDEELLGYAQLDSRLEGHPRPRAALG